MAADPIIVVSYDPGWRDEFALLGGSLRKALGDVALRIDHIGSTAIPGMPAKPVIDIQISVAGLEPAEPYRKPLEALGFAWRHANPDLTKRYFRERPGDRRTHIHVRRAGTLAEQLSLLFRDYLRVNNEDARRYSALKVRLAEQYRGDRQGYVNAKSPLIWEIFRNASDWSQAVGWEPGPPDA